MTTEQQTEQTPKVAVKIDVPKYDDDGAYAGDGFTVKSSNLGRDFVSLSYQGDVRISDLRHALDLVHWAERPIDIPL